MIKISKIPVHLIKKLLLFSFVSFLMISILHDHKFEIGIDTVVFNDHYNDSANIDHFLDSELNCIIHSYSSAISIEFESLLIEDIIPDQNIVTQKNDNLPKQIAQSHYQLRGPPLKLA